MGRGFAETQFFRKGVFHKQVKKQQNEIKVIQFSHFGKLQT